MEWWYPQTFQMDTAFYVGYKSLQMVGLRLCILHQRIHRQLIFGHHPLFPIKLKYVVTTCAQKSDLANKLYPVGSIYMSVNATNPAELFGGTWEQIKGRFLLGTGSNDANTTDLWGSEWAGHYNVPAGELGGESWHTLTVDQMPSHTHQAYVDNNYSGSRIGDTNPWKQSLVNRDLHLLSDGYYFGFTGGNQPHNNMPPYLAVYMWKRTA